MKRNEHLEFVGVAQLIEKQRTQLELFERWASNQEWIHFHESHYDWWMFPIDQPSRLGFAYTVYDLEISELKANSSFMRSYVRGAELVLLSWGWSLYGSKEIEQTASAQCWHNWPIRLAKCVQSLKLFGLEEEYKSAKEYGKLLIQRGADFSFRGKDLSGMFE